MLVTARNFPKEDEVCAWRLHPNTRNQAKGMLEVLRLAHVNSEFESRVSVRPSNPYPTVASARQTLKEFACESLNLALFYGPVGKNVILKEKWK